MLAIPLPVADLHLNGTLSLAAVNNPRLCVVSGPTDAIAAFEETLAKDSVACRRLITSHAFHSEMMEPILESFQSLLSTISLQPPRIPYLSNVSGTWIKPEEATSPAYWARHIRRTVRFSDCLSELFHKPERILIEIGPGNTLTSLARQQGGKEAKAYQSLPHPRDTATDVSCALQTLGQIWTQGAKVNWAKLHPLGSAQRVSLPTYPFEHQKFWIEPDQVQAPISPSPEVAPQPSGGKELPIYRRVWKPAPVSAGQINGVSCWIIFNDSLGLGNRIAATLREKNQDVVLVASGTAFKHAERGDFTIRPEIRADYDALVTEVVKNGYQPDKVLHLWSVTSENGDPRLEETLERSFYSPLYLAQALADQDICNSDIAFVSSRMQQVSEEPVRNPARGVVLGLARVIPKELPGITCRSIDVDLEEVQREQCATQIVAELMSLRENATIAFRNGARFVETLEQLSLEGTSEIPRLKQRGIYLITGGLGGIGLIVAEHLAREFNARLVLVSRSALPPEEKWEAFLDDAQGTVADKQRIRQLIAIRSIGGGLLVAHADVTNLRQMRTVIDMARKQYGRIDGVFHAAGVLDDGPLMLKTAESAARVLAPKVHGTLVLEEALGETPLGCFVLFSSISSIFPPAGQVDYAAANAFLDAFALSRKGLVTVVNWGAWRDVGMGARSASPHPLLKQRLLETPREKVYATQFSIENQWLLSEHRMKIGKALIPGTGYLEMAAAAFTRGSFAGPIQFENVFFLAPLTFGPLESKEVRVQLRLDEEGVVHKGTFRFSIFAKAGSVPASEWVEHSTGLIAPCSGHPPTSIDRAAVTARCNELEIAFDEQHRTRQEQYFDFGPRWRCINRLNIGKGEGLAELQLDARFSSDCSTFLMHPALLDLATGCALYLTDGYASSADLHLPLSYKRICIYHTFPSRIFSHMRARPENVLHGEVEIFDITLFDEQNHILAEIEGFTMRRIKDGGEVVAAHGMLRHAELSGGEQRIEVADHPGIPPLEAVRALTRILRASIPPVIVVVSEPIGNLNSIKPTQSPQPPRAIAPDVATGNERIDETLTAWWQDLLGVEHVAPDDDFFELGGHSLVGVRLLAKIKKKYQVDLELAVLFEARTVPHLAEVISRKKQPANDKPKIWSSLVPIQTNGTRVPLFCVHAIGGDVLFYQQLSNALGHDQPFYAFQSPLVAGEVRETTLEELASIYVNELRAFYPDGPYLLAGASLGGHIAFEMARQLSAQGAEPALLVLIDAGIPGSAEPLKTRTKLHSFLKRLHKGRLRFFMRVLSGKIAYAKLLLTRRIRIVECAGYRLAGRQLPMRLHYFQAEEAHIRALQRYVFQSYPAKITLFRATDRGESLGSREHPTLGWGRYAGGGVEIHDIFSGHISMLFEPYVHNFAKALNAILPS